MPAAGSYICRVDVTIRANEPRDAADLADVFFRSVRQVALSAYTADQVRAWAPEPRTAEWAHGEASDGRLVLVAANADDRPVAYIDLEPNGHIDRVFCTPEAAGKGIASRLYDAVEAAARERGIRSLFTEASELARRLFERKGFAVAERQDLVIRGVTIHNYRMAKTLDLPQTTPDLAGVAGFEPAASSSRSQVHKSPRRAYLRADLLGLSGNVRRGPCRDGAIVTQLVTQ
jgi:putative acetyltransferase